MPNNVPEDAQSEWVHMMMKRLERLECDNDKLRFALDDAKHHIKRLERVALKYNTGTVDFTDQSLLDWLIWEPVESAHIWDAVKRQWVPMPDEFFDALVDYPEPPVEFMMPFHAEGAALLKLAPGITAQTIRCIMRLVYNFYNDTVDVHHSENKVLTLKANGQIERAQQMYKQGKKDIQWLDVVGQRGYDTNAAKASWATLYKENPPSEADMKKELRLVNDATHVRRPYKSGIGMTSFQGLTHIGSGRYMINLGPNTHKAS